MAAIPDSIHNAYPMSAKLRPSSTSSDEEIPMLDISLPPPCVSTPPSYPVSLLQPTDHVYRVHIQISEDDLEAGRGPSAIRTTPGKRLRRSPWPREQLRQLRRDRAETLLAKVCWSIIMLCVIALVVGIVYAAVHRKGSGCDDKLFCVG